MKKSMQRSLAVILSVLLLLSFAACGKDNAQNTPKEKQTVRLAMLKGPTGIGAARLMEQNEAEKTANIYEMNLLSDPTAVMSGFAGQGAEFDMAACPLNMASVLYNKTNGNVQILAVNTLGTLYLVSTQEIKSVKDLKGKTIIAAGQGASPEYVLNYLLEKNGVKEDVTVEFKSEHAEVATLAASATEKDNTIYLLPEPNVTVTQMKNPALKYTFDLSKSFEEVSGVALAMGCIVVKKDFAEQNPEAIKAFLTEYEQSVLYTSEHLDETAALCEKYEIIPKAPIAKKAIPRCSITFKVGDEMKKIVTENLNVLKNANPKAIGGNLPGEDFYYAAK